jgi:glycosyltransferase involved in cell wall biosynthesis
MVISIGTNVPRKRFTLLAGACKELPDVRLVVAGEGTESVTHLPSNGGGGRVEGLGRVSDEQLEGLYRRAELLVLVSTYEGLGLPVLEAWRAGCRILVTEAVAKRLPRRVAAAATVVPTDLTAEDLREAIRVSLARPATRRPELTLEQDPTLCEVLAARLAAT